MSIDFRFNKHINIIIFGNQFSFKDFRKIYGFLALIWKVS